METYPDGETQWANLAEAHRSNTPDDAARALLRLVYLVAKHRTSTAGLHGGIKAAAPSWSPSLHVTAHRSVTAILRRARDLAQAAGRRTTPGDLRTALMEAEAHSVGIDLKRLETARVWVHRHYSLDELPLRLRQYCSNNARTTPAARHRSPSSRQLPALADNTGHSVDKRDSLTEWLASRPKAVEALLEQSQSKSVVRTRGEEGHRE